MSNIHEVIAAIMAVYPAVEWTDGTISSCDITPDTAVVHESGLRITQAQIDRASIHLSRIIDLAKEWQWTAVEQRLDRAYAALGSKNEGTGYDFHRGVHPVQQYLHG